MAGDDAPVALSLYARARRYNASANPGVNLTCFFGLSTATVTSLSWPSGDVSRQPSAATGDGDGVVPSLSAKAVPRGDGAYGVHTRGFSGVQHNALLSDRTALEALISLL